MYLTNVAWRPRKDPFYYKTILFKSTVKLAQAKNKVWETTNVLNLDQLKVTKNQIYDWLMAM